MPWAVGTGWWSFPQPLFADSVVPHGSSESVLTLVECGDEVGHSWLQLVTFHLATPNAPPQR